MKYELYLAPLKGITDVVYRNCLRKLFAGYDVAITPFISTERGGVGKPRFIREVLPANNTRLPVIPQLLSNDAGQFEIYANALYALGYETVNWNLGCPSPMVLSRKRGAGLLPFPDFIDSFLERVSSATSGEISVKMRLGRDDESEIFRLLPVLNRYPLSEIIIHPRTGAQLYSGDVNLEAFEMVLSLTDHTVVYSGDIWSLERFQDLARRFPGVKRWMLGRGALKNPFLAAMIKGLNTPAAKHETMKRFHDLLLSEYTESCSGSHQTLGKMKALWRYFSHWFPESPLLLKKIYKARKLSVYTEAVESIFSTDKPPKTIR